MADINDSTQEVSLLTQDGIEMSYASIGAERTQKVAPVDTTNAHVNPATEDTLALIKNTDGIKKITDALPAGTNILGATRFVDEAGVAYGVKHVENKLRTVSSPYGYAVSEGEIPGHHALHVFGAASDVDNAIEDVWSVGGMYVFPTAAMQMEIVSSSANDTLAGTGVQKVLIHYLDGSHNEQTEIINMNGTTPVATVATNILRVNSFHSYQVGTGVSAAGIINLRHISDTPIYAQILTGFNMSEHAVFTVPAGHVCFITSWGAYSGSTGGNAFGKFYLTATTHLEVSFNFFMTQDMLFTQDGGSRNNFEVPIKLPEKTDLKISVISDGAASNVTAVAHINGWYEA